MYPRAAFITHFFYQWSFSPHVYELALLVPSVCDRYDVSDPRKSSVDLNSARMKAIKLKTNKTSKSNLKKKQTPCYTISYTNVRNLHFNFPEVELHLLLPKPDLLFLSETGTNVQTPLQNLPSRATHTL